ncbi:hypothetical protein Tco_0474190 [Tanacetum coccineum]|uniref:Uncharacterized protein n=1 Tax=Tanacetum coccineum TaxID=301880 RepID=A0ABQ5A5T4_9ASTR
MYRKENVDFPALIWEDLQYQIDNHQPKVRRRDIIPYLRFTKIIINYFLFKHNSIYKRHGSKYNTFEDDGVLGRLKFISKGEEHQVYGKPIPDILVTDDIQNSKAYKTFIALSTGLIPPKKGRGKRAKGMMTSNNVYFKASFIPSKRRALWRLNEDILNITVLKTNTPYPSRKIRRIGACTHQRPQRNKDQYAVSRGLNMPYSRYGINIIF